MNTSTKIQLTELYWERYPLLVLKTPEPWTPGRTVNGHTLADGQEWHRTDGWTKEMLPAGTRPILGFPTPDLGTIESSLDGVNWWPQFTQEVLTKHVTENPHAFWRTTRPLPSVAKPITPEKWAAEKAAFATGKKLEVRVKGRPSGAWFRCPDPEWLEENEYRIAPEPILVELGSDDVTPETDAIRFSSNPRQYYDLANRLQRERDELRAKLQYVTGQLIEAGCDCGVAPVEELARRAKKDIAALKTEAARLKAACEKEFASVEKLDLECSQLKADKARLDWLERGDQFTRVFRDGKVICERHYGHGQGIRVAIDAAMKGAE